MRSPRIRPAGTTTARWCSLPWVPLPPNQREVVLLRHWLGLTDVQIAATLGCSVGNVKSQSSRALAKLRISAELADWMAQ